MYNNRVPNLDINIFSVLFMFWIQLYHQDHLMIIDTMLAVKFSLLHLLPHIWAIAFLVHYIPWAYTLVIICTYRHMVSGRAHKMSLKWVLALGFASQFKLLFQVFFLLVWWWPFEYQPGILRITYVSFVKFCSSCSLSVCWHIVLCLSSRSSRTGYMTLKVNY